MNKSRLPLILIAGGSVLALIVLAVILMSGSGGSETTAEQTTVVKLKPAEVTPVPEPTPEATRRSSSRGAAVFGTSVRDPFMPLATPSSSGGTSSTDATKAKSSNPKSSTTTKSTQKVGIAKTDASGTGSGEAKAESTKSKTKKKGSKAPQPIGGSKKGDTPTQQTEVAVVQVKDSSAVVRINGTRTTLYQNVPDPSGVTYVSSLGGGCGWFGTGDLSERITICEGDSRQLA